MTSYSLRFLACLFALSVLFAAHNANAAFKLIAPPQTAPAATTQQTQTIVTDETVVIAPVAPVQSAALPTGPVLDAGRPAIAPQPLPQVTKISMPAPFQATPLPVISETAAPVPSAMRAPVANDTVKGFGKNVPLHTALRQIAPSGYEFSYGTGVNPAQNISWQGNQSWRDVLTTSLQKQGLTYRESGSVISIHSTQPKARLEKASFSAPLPKEAQTLPLSDFNRPLMVAMHQTLPPAAPAQPVKKVAADAPVVIDSATPGVVTETTQTTTQVVTEQAPAAQPLPLPTTEATAPAVNSVSAVAPSQTWIAAPGSTLHATLQQWCNQVGAELTWDSEYDYPIQAPVNVQGTFDDAVRTVLKGFANANPPPKGQIYTGQGQQAILVITAPGNDYTN